MSRAEETASLGGLRHHKKYSCTQKELQQKEKEKREKKR
jgi:hypothetical protein